MTRLHPFQRVSIAVGVLIASALLVYAYLDWRWAGQPLVKAFYDLDMLTGPRDSDGLFHAPAFDALIGLPLAEARQRIEAASFACEPVDAATSFTHCTYGYETETGCCRFRLRLDFTSAGKVLLVRGDKVGRCPR